MKNKFLLAVIMIFTILMTACSSAGHISTYTISLDTIPKNFDPQVATNQNELLVLTNIFDGLVEYRDGRIENNVAESYTISPDGRTYTFKLKKNSTFYLSKKQQIPVTSDDFAFALERIVSPDTHSPYYEDFKHITSIETPDDSTLIIKLDKADSNFLSKLAMPAAFPCNREFFKQSKGAYGLNVKNILSNGPYTINYLADDDSYITMIRVVESKNAIDRIRISLKGEESYDKLYNDDKISGFFAENEKQQNISGTVHSYENSHLNLTFNLQNPILQNQNIRSAFSYFAYAMQNSGANPDAVSPTYSIFTNAVTFGDTTITQAVSPTTPLYMNANPKELITQGMAEAGISKLEGLKVLIPSDNKYSVIMENINQFWQKELGVFLTLEFVPTQEIEQRVRKGDYDIAFVNYVPQANDPLLFIEPYAQYDTAITDIVNKIKESSNHDVIISNIKSAQDIVLNKAYVAPMCSSISTYYHKNYFTNVDVNPFGNIVNLKYAKAK